MDPQEILANPALISAMLNEFKPAIGVVCKELLEGLKTLNQQEEFFTEMGKLTRNHYEGYIRAGFTEGEAMLLLLRDKERYAEMYQKAAKEQQAANNNQNSNSENKTKDGEDVVDAEFTEEKSDDKKTK